jgi:glycosyltransferase involved in cell wall biosynthesis
MTASLPRISAFVVCCNEERNIRRCLESIAWCDEIVVIDSGSTDRTLEICREFNTRIYERPWPGFVAQKQFGLEQCRGEWILNLDADEEVSPELRMEIERVITNPTAQNFNGFLLSRVVFYLNRWWRKGGWYPEYRLRLCRRTATTWGGKDPHEKATVTGRTRRLEGELRHYTYTDMAHQVRSLHNYSSTAARSMYANGKHASLVNLLLNPPARFLKFYMLKRGYREGLPGLIVALLESYYVFLKYAKLWELSHPPPPSAPGNHE